MSETPAVSIGDVFDTPFERSCEVVTAPDANGNFEGIDSDGARAQFSVEMISRVLSAPEIALRRACSKGEPILGNPALTKEGRAFALANADDSIVCRVALAGYDTDWPETHVRTAIETCNVKGSVA